jgi:hypothetical protein
MLSQYYFIRAGYYDYYVISRLPQGAAFSEKTILFDIQAN